MRYNRIAAVFLAVIFAALLLYDLSLTEAGSSIEYPLPPTVAPFSGTVTLSGMHYVAESRSIDATLHLDIEANEPNVAITDVAVALTSNADGSVNFIRDFVCPSKAPGASSDGDGKRRATLAMGCGPVVLLRGQPRTERRYPFDRYAITLRLRGCINVVDCANVSNVNFSYINVDLSDPDFVADVAGIQNALEITIERKFFVKMAAIVFLLMSVVFLVYLAWEGDAKDLLPKSLGLFAALWGLRAIIVPASIHTFPTAVDYTVFTIFCLLFAIVLFKLPTKGLTDDSTMVDGIRIGSPDQRADGVQTGSRPAAT